MTSKRTLIVLLLLVTAVAASAADSVTVGTVTAVSNNVDVPVSIRDVSGTPLGLDKPSGSRIQSFSMKVTYSPASSVQSISFSRAGITSSLNPSFESSPSTSTSISLLATFQESTNLIPFTLDPRLTILSDRAGLREATAGNGLLQLHDTIAGDGRPSRNGSGN